MGGTIVFEDGQSLVIPHELQQPARPARRSRATWLMNLPAVLRIAGGLTVNGGAIRLTGDATTLAFEGTQTWSTGNVFFEGSTVGRRIIEAVNGGTTLTFGRVSRSTAVGDLGGSRFFGNNFTLINGGPHHRRTCRAKPGYS